MKMSVRRRSPPDARARRPRARGSLPREPSAARLRKSERSRSRRRARGARRAVRARGPSPGEPSSARPAPPGATRRTSRTMPSPPQSTPSSWTTSPVPGAPPSPVTAGAKPPTSHRNASFGSAASGTPAASRHDEVAPARDRRGGLAEGLRHAAVGVVDGGDGGDADRRRPRIGRTTRAGRLRAGPVTRARRTRPKPLRRSPGRPSPPRRGRPAGPPPAECVARSSVTPRSRRISSSSARTCFAVAAVEIAGRLVREKEPRAGDQGARDGDPLHLAAGELVRDARRRGAASPTRVEQVRAPADRRRRARRDAAAARRSRGPSGAAGG